MAGAIYPPARVLDDDLDLLAAVAAVALFTPRQQMVHDLVTGTLMLRRSPMVRHWARDSRRSARRLTSLPAVIGCVHRLIARQGSSMTDQTPENTQLFLTAAMPCPYLPGKQERKLFTHLTGRRASRCITCSARTASAGART